MTKRVKKSGDSGNPMCLYGFDIGIFFISNGAGTGGSLNHFA